MTEVSAYDVTVVIPSVGRPELAKAIQSVRNQTVTDRVEVIVVLDIIESAATGGLKETAAHADHVIYTQGREGAPRARNLGVRAARGSWIAFLDDDDAWDPTKIESQLEAGTTLRNQGKLPVIGCRARLVYSDGSKPPIPEVPARLIDAGEDIGEYLFAKRRAGSRRASFFTSSILAPIELCKEVPWSEGLRRHQDWDWLLAASGIENVVFSHVPRSLLSYSLGSADSISATNDWFSSLKWARNSRPKFSSRAYTDFICAQPMRYALQARDIRGIREVARVLRGEGRLPSIGPILIAGAGLLPRKALQRLMSVTQ